MRTPRRIYLLRPAATRLGAETRISNLSSFGFSPPVYRFILAFLLIIAFQLCRYTAQASGSSNNRNWQRPGQSKPVPPLRWGRNKKLARARSTDGVDYLEFESKAPKDQKKQQSPEGDNSSGSTTDLDESDNALDDLSADTPRRGDHNLVHFSVCDLVAVKTRTSQTTQFSLPPDPSFYCLHAHSPERGPPSFA